MEKQTFKELGLNGDVVKAIDKLGYEIPSDIQQEIIPLIMNNYDCLGQAQTGTGKTLAFASAILSKLDKDMKALQTIVLAPTRELAVQIKEEFESLNESGFRIETVYGGSSIEAQIKALKRGTDIVVGTPGRVIDLIERKVLRLDNIRFFVLDEADEMLNMGFLEDIETIFNHCRNDKQVLLFSATMPKAIVKLASKYMKKDLKQINIASVSRTADSVKQYYYLVNHKDRTEALCRILDDLDKKSVIIFCGRKVDCDALLTSLQERRYSAETMHGDIVQSMRIQTLERFKNGSFKYLIATDVAARGIHVNNIDCVINYNIAQDVESYIHRIGRTGRAGKEGMAISIVSPKEVSFLDQVMKEANCNIEYKELPTYDNIYEARRQKIIREIENTIDSKEYLNQMDIVRDMNKDQLLKVAASLFKLAIDKEIKSDFKNDLKVKVRSDRRNMVKQGQVRVFLTVGKIDKIKKGSLLDFLKKETKIDKDNFNNIDILNKFTFLDVDKRVVDDFIKLINKKKFNDREVRVEKAKKK